MYEENIHFYIQNSHNIYNIELRLELEDLHENLIFIFSTATILGFTAI